MVNGPRRRELQFRVARNRVRTSGLLATDPLNSQDGRSLWADGHPPPEPRQNIVRSAARNSQIIGPARKFYDVPKISTRSVDNLVERLKPSRADLRPFLTIPSVWLKFRQIYQPTDFFAVLYPLVDFLRGDRRDTTVLRAIALLSRSL